MPANSQATYHNLSFISFTIINHASLSTFFKSHLSCRFNAFLHSWRLADLSLAYPVEIMSYIKPQKAETIPLFEVYHLRLLQIHLYLYLSSSSLSHFCTFWSNLSSFKCQCTSMAMSSALRMKSRLHILCIELEEIGRSTVSVDQIKSNKRIQDKRDACPTSTASKTA
jgi:hypothetical protein